MDLLTPTRSAVSLAAVTALLAGSLTACGSDRSPEAYCRAFYAKAAPIREKYVQAGEQSSADPLGGLAIALQAPGDFVSILDGMVDHAPDEIRSDTAQVRDTLKKVQDNMSEGLSNPVGALGSSLIASASSAGAERRVGEYLEEHCPVDSPLAQEYINEASGG